MADGGAIVFICRYGGNWPKAVGKCRQVGMPMSQKVYGRLECTNQRRKLMAAITCWP